jgi:hypothetical protein
MLVLKFSCMFCAMLPNVLVIKSIKSFLDKSCSALAMKMVKLALGLHSGSLLSCLQILDKESKELTAQQPH